MPLPTPNFRNLRKYMGPPWLVSNGESALVGFTLDCIKDAYLTRTRNGLLFRFPQTGPNGTTAPEDALAAIGRDRRIVRGINETRQSYAVRLLAWLDAWKRAGSPFGLLSQLAAYTGPGPAFRTVDVRGNWFSIDADGTQSVLINQANWDWDGDPNALVHWSRFWVIIYPNGLWTEGPTWGTPGDVWGQAEQTWGSTATPEEVSTLQAIVANWKPAGTRCVNIILAFDDTSFDPTQPRDGTGLPDGLWGHWSTTVNNQRVPSRLSTARYLDGV